PLPRRAPRPRPPTTMAASCPTWSPGPINPTAPASGRAGPSPTWPASECGRPCALCTGAGSAWPSGAGVSRSSPARRRATARSRGAAAARVEREQAVDVPQILVRDGRRAAAVAAEAWYDRPAAKLDLVGVTGTNGKTTSVTLLRHVLSALEPTGSIGTLGAFDPAGDPVPSEAGNLTTPGPIHLQAPLA